jgi:flagellar biosynthetic protein FliP
MCADARLLSAWVAPLALAALSAGCSGCSAIAAGPGLPLLVGQGAGGTSYSVPIQTLLFFTALSSCRRCCC